jgi:hypothetical protein
MADAVFWRCWKRRRFSPAGWQGVSGVAQQRITALLAESRRTTTACSMSQFFGGQAPTYGLAALVETVAGFRCASTRQGLIAAPAPARIFEPKQGLETTRRLQTVGGTLDVPHARDGLCGAEARAGQANPCPVFLCAV